MLNFIEFKNNVMQTKNLEYEIAMKSNTLHIYNRKWGDF